MAGWYNQVHKRALDIVNATQMGQGCFRLAYEDGGPSDRRLSNSLMQRNTRSELPKATGWLRHKQDKNPFPGHVFASHHVLYRDLESIGLTKERKQAE